MPLPQLFRSVLQPSKSIFVYIYKIKLSWSVKTLEISSSFMAFHKMSQLFWNWGCSLFLDACHESLTWHISGLHLNIHSVNSLNGSLRKHHHHYWKFLLTDPQPLDSDRETEQTYSLCYVSLYVMSKIWVWFLSCHQKSGKIADL